MRARSWWDVPEGVAIREYPGQGVTGGLIRACVLGRDRTYASWGLAWGVGVRYTGDAQSPRTVRQCLRSSSARTGVDTHVGASLQPAFRPGPRGVCPDPRARRHRRDRHAHLAWATNR